MRLPGERDDYSQNEDSYCDYGPNHLGSAIRLRIRYRRAYAAAARLDRESRADTCACPRNAEADTKHAVARRSGSAGKYTSICPSPAPDFYVHSRPGADTGSNAQSDGDSRSRAGADFYARACFIRRGRSDGRFTV